MKDSGHLPWTRSCFVCGQDNPHGLRLKARAENGRVVIEHTARDADRGWRHIVHGGITMTLLDEAMTWAAILRARRACVAAEMTTRLRRPIEVGQRLRVEAEVVEARPKLLLTSAKVTDASGQVLAAATGKYVPMPEGQISLCDKDFVSAPHTLKPEELFL
ncbi:MAG: PaaI family thioesterase [Elusimicrobiota bacterium]